MILAAAIALRQEASPPIALGWRDGQLCVPLDVGEERPVWLLLDTGARRSTLGRTAFERLRAKGTVGEDGTLTLRGASIGGYPLPPLRFAGETNDDPPDGCLGVDLLSRYRVGLDLREKTLRLWPVGRTPDGWFTGPPEERVQVALVERTEGWCVPVEVGNLTVPMVLDTGASATFLHADVAALLRGAKKAKREDPPMTFYDGQHRVRAYSVRPVGLGGASFGTRTIRVARVPRMVGLLGRDLLSPLKALLDYPASKATFAGFEFVPLPPRNGPTVTLSSGVVVHWTLGEVANAPPGCAYTLPRGYREVFNRDESVDLVPPKGG